jgi:hypothetical protein
MLRRRARSVRHLQLRLRILAFGVILIAASRAYAIPDEQVCDEKARPGLLAEGKCLWWKSQQDYVRASTNCCLPTLKKVKQLQTKALDHREKSRDMTRPKAERDKHFDLSKEFFAKRDKQADKFTDCVNEIKTALDTKPLAHQRESVAHACGGQVDFIENLGWRRCVDLSRSSLLVDRALSAARHGFNCHFYVKSYVRSALGEPVKAPNAFSFDDCLKAKNYDGWTRSSGPAHEGDLLLVEGPDAHPCDFNHTAVVIQVNPDGTPKRIRQKDGPNTCVVDLDWDEFQRVWVVRSDIKPVVYTNPDHPGLPRVP